jgi:hypothetical protein
MGKKSKRAKGSSEDSSSDSSSSDDNSSSETSEHERETSPERKSSGDSSDSSDAGRKKKKKTKKKSKSKSKNDKKKDKKKRNKNKKSKQSKKNKCEDLSSFNMNSRWGLHGVIKESDIHSKEAEYYAWLYEVKGVSRENLGRKEEKTMFREFMEDYNTSTFPDDKYYDLGRWQATQVAQKPANVYNSRISDEERLRLERQQEHEKKKDEIEKARVMVFAEALREGKKQGSEKVKEIEKRNAPGSFKPTFESIAADRERRKRAEENAFRPSF